MKILTWNIQATRGCDNRFDAVRIVNDIKAFGVLDVICLQEVSRFIPDLNADDQLELIAGEFAGYERAWAPGFSVPDGTGKRCEFGNLTLVRSELFLYSREHSLPSPFVETLQMPRTMVEVVVQASDRELAVFNTHLAFHSSKERVEQIQQLTRLRDQQVAKSGASGLADSIGPYLYTHSTDAVILCGDLNVDSDDRLFVEHVTSMNWIDCWALQTQSDSHACLDRQPTCGCFDHIQWPQGPHVRDYFLATSNIASRTMRVEVDVKTKASDHQPLVLELAL